MDARAVANSASSALQRHLNIFLYKLLHRWQEKKAPGKANHCCTIQWRDAFPSVTYIYILADEAHLGWA